MGACKVLPVWVVVAALVPVSLEQKVLALDINTPTPPVPTFTCVAPSTTVGQPNYCAPCKDQDKGIVGCHCTSDQIPAGFTEKFSACTCCKQDNCDKVKDLKTICCCDFPLEAAETAAEELCNELYHSDKNCPSSGSREACN